MKFIEWPPLTRLCALLHNLDVGDRVIRGRLELLSTASKGLQEKHLQEKIETELCSSPLFAASSPPPLLLSPCAAAAADAAVGDVHKHHGGPRCSSRSSRLRQQEALQSAEKNRELLVHLIGTLNQCFPDYEFSSTLTPAMFCEEQSLEAVQADVNQRLGGVERVLPGFIAQLWEAIGSAVCLGSCSVYSHLAANCEDPSPLISLFSSAGMAPREPAVSLSCFFYFFLDRHRHRLLFFACASNCKMGSPSWLGEEGGGPSGEFLDDSDEVDIGEVYGAEATMQAEPEPAEEADSLSDLELPSSACAYA
ncbi:hypothetical protein Esti_006348 [Eimeria stiedai]